jgi:hypothetical protein
MDIDKVIEAYLARSPSLVNENANQGFSMSGLKTTIAEHVLKDDLLSKSPAAAFHRTGAMHLHDSGGGEFAAYCHGGDLRAGSFELRYSSGPIFARRLIDSEAGQAEHPAHGIQPFLPVASSNADTIHEPIL